MQACHSLTCDLGSSTQESQATTKEPLMSHLPKVALAAICVLMLLAAQGCQENPSKVAKAQTDGSPPATTASEGPAANDVETPPNQERPATGDQDGQPAANPAAPKEEDMEHPFPGAGK